MFCLHHASYECDPWGCPSSCIRHDMLDIHTFSSWTGTMLGRSWGRSRLLCNISTWMVRTELAKNLIVHIGHRRKPPFPSQIVMVSLHVLLHDQLHLEADTANFTLAGEPSVYRLHWWFTSFFSKTKIFSTCFADTSIHVTVSNMVQHLAPNFQRKLHFIVPSST